ncbi:MAG: hypothetical protein K2Y23_06470 [Cyanobacteria bacterium]|nr:hypothetical protein [Cyanobacteriota bacterium]
MAHATFWMLRLTWTVCACICVLTPRSVIAGSRLTLERNSDGQRGNVTSDLCEPSVVGVWVSEPRLTSVTQSRAPLLRAATGDLDDDQRPDLIASELRMHVWTRHDEFRQNRAHPSYPSAEPGAARPPPAHIPA